MQVWRKMLDRSGLVSIPPRAARANLGGPRRRCGWREKAAFSAFECLAQFSQSHRIFCMTSLRVLFLLLLTSLAWSPAHAQERRVPASQAELMLSYAPVVRRERPAVVNADDTDLPLAVDCAAIFATSSM